MITTKTGTISDCGKYRYSLALSWMGVQWFTRPSEKCRECWSDVVADGMET